MRGTRLDDIPERWLQMWTAESDLADELMVDETRQWSGRTPALDTVIGPRAAAEFMTWFRNVRGVRYSPRVIVADEESGLLAYTWNAVDKDGDLFLGLDFNTVRDGRVIDNWTVSWPRDDREDIAGTGHASAEELTELCAARARNHAGVLYRPPAIDIERQTAAYLWAPETGGPGGLSLIIAADGSVGREFSLPAQRAFTY